MTATLNMVVSINSTTVMHTFGTASFFYSFMQDDLKKKVAIMCLAIVKYKHD